MEGTGEIIKSGALTTITDLVKTLAGPAFEELGAMFADNVRVYRVQNLIRTTKKTKRILADAGLEPSAVPSRLLLPILDHCSVEDDDGLQERWAGLLASASQESDSLSPSFVETLKQLTPNEAKHCDHIFLEVSKRYKRSPTHHDPILHYWFTKAGGAPTGASETYERLGLIRRDHDVKVKMRGGSIVLQAEDTESTENDISNVEAEVGYRYCFTAYAVRFIEACRGPRKEKSIHKNERRPR